MFLQSCKIETITKRRCQLPALQFAFLHKKSRNFRVRWAVHKRRNEVLSSTKADTFRGSCWQTANSAWHCSLLSSVNLLIKHQGGRGHLRSGHTTCVTVWKQFLQYLEKLQQLMKFCSGWKHHQVLILLLPFVSVKQRGDKREPLDDKGENYEGSREGSKQNLFKCREEKSEKKCFLRLTRWICLRETLFVQILDRSMHKGSICTAEI